MAQIALFHSVLGVRAGIIEAAERLQAQGHHVLTVDQYAGQMFDDYQQAGAFAAQIGYPTLMGDALTAVESLADGFLCVGFSNGGGMAEYVASNRPVAGVVMCSGALALSVLELEHWPARVPAQIHYTLGDPFRRPGAAEALVQDIRAAGGECALYDYPGSGHLFTDRTLPAEYDHDCAELFWQRVETFCREHG